MSLYLLKVLVNLPVEIPLTHLLKSDLVLFTKSIYESSVGVEEDGVLAVIVVKLILHAPPL